MLKADEEQAVAEQFGVESEQVRRENYGLGQSRSFTRPRNEAGVDLVQVYPHFSLAFASAVELHSCQRCRCRTLPVACASCSAPRPVTAGDRSLGSAWTNKVFLAAPQGEPGFGRAC